MGKGRHRGKGMTGRHGEGDAWGRRGHYKAAGMRDLPEAADRMLTCICPFHTDSKRRNSKQTSSSHQIHKKDIVQK